MADGHRGSRFRPSRTGAARRAARAGRRRLARHDPFAPVVLRGVLASGPWHRGAAGLPAGRRSTPICWRAPSASRCARSSCRPSAATSSIATGRVLAYSVDADTISAVPTEIDDPDDGGRAASAARSTTATPQSARRSPSGCARSARSPTSRGRSRRSEAERVAALELRASASSRRAGASTRTRSWRRTCSATSASTTSGWAGSSRPTTRRSAARTARSWSRPTRGATRSAASSGRRPPAPALELTIDEYLQHIAERELRAGVVENRAAGGTAIIMDPHTGEILALAN